MYVCMYVCCVFACVFVSLSLSLSLSVFSCVCVFLCVCVCVLACVVGECVEALSSSDFLEPDQCTPRNIVALPLFGTSYPRRFSRLLLSDGISSMKMSVLLYEFNASSKLL